MLRFPSMTLTLLAALPVFVRGQDTGPSAETIAAVKRASVFIKVQGSGWEGTGSGFVVKAEKDTVLVATNYHVLVGTKGERLVRPSEAMKLARTSRVELVFDSGTKDARTTKAEVAAVDPESDLAIFRVTGMANPPVPIDLAAPPKLVELMAVYSFGFPFGNSLGVGKSSPAVTVGKASISSLRLAENGELAVVQIDGNLNPGNSGGPVVNARGQLVGVAVAKIRDGQGIGFAIPATELNGIMGGRLGRPYVTATPGTKGKVIVKAEVATIDPQALIRGVSLHYVLVEPKGKQPGKMDSLKKFAGSQRVALKIEGGIAVGEVILEKPKGELFVQATVEGPASQVASVIRRVDLAGPAMLAQGKLPEGWRETVDPDYAFSVWLPEKVARSIQHNRTFAVNGLQLRSTGARITMPGFLTYQVECITLPTGADKKLNRKDLEQSLIDYLTNAIRGKIIEEIPVQSGAQEGKQYRIQAGRKQCRLRLFMTEKRVFIIQVLSGRTAEEVDSLESDAFLNSLRLESAVARKDLPSWTKPGQKLPAGTPLTEPKMLGHLHGPVFRDVDPAGGLLVGLELGLNKERTDVISSVRPIFRNGNTESFGAKQGTGSGPRKTIKAKPGYAIGALTMKVNHPIHGLSVTFFKVQDGKLLGSDSYESEWIGNNPDNVEPTKVDCREGTVIGLIGRAEPSKLQAIGLLTKDHDFQATRMIGGGGNSEYREVAPPGFVLVGFEIALGKFFDNDVIHGLRPVYRNGDKEEFGGQRGTVTNRVVRHIAKPGYAVGSVSIRAGLGLDGMSIMFMKLAEGKLNPRDGYETDWIGGQGGGGPEKLGGDGLLVIGTFGKAHGTNTAGLGLILK